MVVTKRTGGPGAPRAKVDADATHLSVLYDGKRWPAILQHSDPHRLRVAGGDGRLRHCVMPDGHHQQEANAP
jgi:hypothetical protein